MSTLVLDSVSRWFGNVVAVNDVSMTIGPGVTGLLGPNGAGKTTLMAMMSGFLPPSSGTVTIDGAPVWRRTDAYRHIGLVPERELSFGYLTGRAFVRANADLHRLPEAARATEHILGVVDMVEPAGRRIDTYSKGMRQRIKIAAALVHDPSILLLDEPFNGVDPRQRMHLMELLRRLGDEGRRKPDIIAISVVSPAPFGPSRPVTPGPTVMLTSLTATTLPNQRDTLSRTSVLIGHPPS